MKQRAGKEVRALILFIFRFEQDCARDPPLEFPLPQHLHLEGKQADFLPRPLPRANP